MGIKRRFCIRCGAEESKDNPIIEGLCIKCYIEVKGLISIPNNIEYRLCKDCGAVLYRGKWIRDYNSLEDLFESIVLDNISINTMVSEIRDIGVKFISTPSWRTLIEVEVHGVLKGIKFSQSRIVTLIAKPTLCPMCIMRRSKDYEALVQIRLSSPALRYEVDRILKSKSDKISINVVEVKEPKSDLIDFYLADKGSARKLVSLLRKYFNVNIKTSYEDIGITSKGKMRRRIVYSIHVLGKR